MHTHYHLKVQPISSTDSHFPTQVRLLTWSRNTAGYNSVGMDHILCIIESWNICVCGVCVCECYSIYLYWSPRNTSILKIIYLRSESMTFLKGCGKISIDTSYFSFRDIMVLQGKKRIVNKWKVGKIRKCSIK